MCLCVVKDEESRPHPLLYASSSIFALSSALISALISSKLTGGLAGSLSCSDTLFPLHCFRWERTVSLGRYHHHGTRYKTESSFHFSSITTPQPCFITDKLQRCLSGSVHYRHPEKMELAHLLLLFPSPRRTFRHLRAPLRLTL